MPTSEKELDSLRSDVDSLRAEVAQAERDRVAAEGELANDVTAHQLRTEKDSLQAQLKELKAAATAKAVKAGAAAVLDPNAVAAQQEQARLDALGVPQEATSTTDSTSPRRGARRGQSEE
jgi:hypothetical protein